MIARFRNRTQLRLSHVTPVGKAPGVCRSNVGKRVEVKEVRSFDLAASKAKTTCGGIDCGDTPKHQRQNRKLATQFARSGS